MVLAMGYLMLTCSWRFVVWWFKSPPISASTVIVLLLYNFIPHDLIELTLNGLRYIDVIILSQPDPPLTPQGSHRHPSRAKNPAKQSLTPLPSLPHPFQHQCPTPTTTTSTTSINIITTLHKACHHPHHIKATA